MRPADRRSHTLRVRADPLPLFGMCETTADVLRSQDALPAVLGLCDDKIGHCTRRAGIPPVHPHASTALQGPLRCQRLHSFPCRATATVCSTTLARLGNAHASLSGQQMWPGSDCTSLIFCANDQPLATFQVICTTCCTYDLQRLSRAFTGVLMCCSSNHRISK